MFRSVLLSTIAQGGYLNQVEPSNNVRNFFYRDVKYIIEITLIGYT